MPTIIDGTLWPFGYPEAEDEPNLIDLFYKPPYLPTVVDQKTTILVGRRGAGKTALARYLSSLVPKEYFLHVEIDKKTVLAEAIAAIDVAVGHTPSISSDLLADLWKFLVWVEVARQILNTEEFVSSEHAEPVHSCLTRLGLAKADPLALVNTLLSPIGPRSLVAGKLTNGLVAVSEALASPPFVDLQNCIRKFLGSRRKVLIIIDTIDDYRVRDPLIDRALAGLVAAAASFGGANVDQGLHLKCFIPGELYPYITSTHGINLRKIDPRMKPVRWTGRQLFLMLCRRLANWLEEHGDAQFQHTYQSLDWRNPVVIRQRVWNRVFPKLVLNRRRRYEESFNYIARHTHMHPGQMIWVCNKIAQLAFEDGGFPAGVQTEHIVNGIRTSERKLAESITAPYDAVFPNVTEVLKWAFYQEQAIMPAKKVLELTFKENVTEAWPKDLFPVTEATLLRNAIEIGAIGKVVSKTSSDYIPAQFQFHMDSVLTFQPNERCAVHPAFYRLFDLSTDGLDRAVCPVVLIDESEDWSL